jgi:hypothetical protein
VTTTGPPDDRDGELLAVLARAVQIFDPVPTELTAANKALLTWRDPDAALAELVADSRELAGVARGTVDETILRFAGVDTSIVIQVETSEAGEYLLLGHVEVAGSTGSAPAGPGTVALRRPASGREVAADEWGRFRLEAVRPGPLSFRWTSARPGSQPLDTVWILL